MLIGLIPALLLLACAATGPCRAQSDAPLPPGVKAVWDLDKAFREKTPTRERVCLNGLWRWQPAKAAQGHAVPADNWGYFKVPGCWPGTFDYMQVDCQTLYPHSAWRDESIKDVTFAWYQREFTVPDDWANRRIALYAEYVNTAATVYVDGQKAGDIVFPGGEVELTPLGPPGAKHLLSVFCQACPLKAVVLSFADTSAPKEVKGAVHRRGLCGDIYLVATPAAARITDVKIDPSVRKNQITFDIALAGLAADTPYTLRATVLDHGQKVQEFASPPFTPDKLTDGRLLFTAAWKPEKLWDTHTPQNMYDVNVSLAAGQRTLDAAWPARFGFRELWIDGRDFILNGKRLGLCCVPLDNAEVRAVLATYGAARESLLRLKALGVNCVYTHNYGCEPGMHLSFTEILKAADDTGMLVSLSQPHYAQYMWDEPDADQHNGYARHAEFYVRAAQNHPSVVFYSMSHNSTGYAEGSNPDLLDGLKDPRPAWGLRPAALARRAQAIVEHFDPSRIVYHHSSGNLGAMHTTNFYANFVPIQELSDWLEHWATVGVKPLFTCEYANPGSMDWTMHRGWWQGKRVFANVKLRYEFCLSEWNSQFLGDAAFKSSEMEKENLRWEAKQFRIPGKLWFRWDYPHQVGSSEFAQRQAVYAMYCNDNWRAMRTWGLSASNEWEYYMYWNLRAGVDRNRRKTFPVDWDDLQRPGFSPDFIEKRFERVDLAYDFADWAPNAAGQALLRNNQPLLAYIAGGPEHFTAKDHNFLPGQTVEKQLIIINNSREPVEGDCEWTLALPESVCGGRHVAIPAGAQARIPIRGALPAGLKPGAYELRATVKFNPGETQQDTFSLNILPPAPPPQVNGQIALFDPQGETGRVLEGLSVPCQAVDAKADLSAYDVLVIGKGALTASGPGPNVDRVRDGLKVVVFEQTAQVLEQRFGFRVTEYGLRQVFKRVGDHPLLAGLETDHLRDWRGEATLLTPRLQYVLKGAPMVKWCGLDVPRAWRCGCRGNVASVLIEKPARGDFLPVLDGGYSLQYSPLMEYREGRGLVLFCQMDVSGRTAADPAAAQLARNIVEYVSAWRPSPRRAALYVGEAAGKEHLERAGVVSGTYTGGALTPAQVLVVGPGGGAPLAAHAPDIRAWLKAGGHLLALGLDHDEANAFMPSPISMKTAEHIAAYFEPWGAGTLLAGLSAADAHNRDARDLPLVTGGAQVIGDGVLAKSADTNVVFCQMRPWTFDYQKQFNLKRTFRRSSFLVARLLANMGAAGATPLLARFASPANAGEKRWLNGLYLDAPEEMDDPYRYFCW